MLSVGESGTQKGDAYYKNDVSIQCELLSGKRETPVYFHIKDPRERSRFVTGMYGILIFHQLVCFIGMAGFRIYSTLHISPITYIIHTISLVIIYVGFYLISEKRRYGFLNYATFFIVTLFYISGEVLFAMTMVDISILLQPVCMIVQFIALAVFAKLHCFRKKNFMGFLIIMTIAVIFFMISMFWTLGIVFTYYVRFIIVAGYMLYGVEQILHGACPRYQPIESHEYIFAVTNLYVEYTRFYWMLFRLFVFDVLSIYRFFKNCCQREFC